MNGPRQLKKGEYLFREGDASDAMYVIKTGKIAITKAKGNSEIVLAELAPGEMLGEMAFFDNKPRSAGARAVNDSIVIALPFKSLNAQFKTFPEWLKAVVRTVNSHLRNANQKIKNLEKTSEEDKEVFPPYTITRLIAILAFVTERYGEKNKDGHPVVPGGRLRNYTIQVFQQPTNKMQKLMEILQGLGLLKIEDLGEGRQQITVLKPDFLFGFVEFYNEYLFKDDSKRTTIIEKELLPMKALIFYGGKEKPDDKGWTKVNLTEMQNTCLRDLGFQFSVDDVNSLAEKKIIGEKMSQDGSLAVKFVLADVQTIQPYWEIIYLLKKIQSS